MTFWPPVVLYQALSGPMPPSAHSSGRLPRLGEDPRADVQGALVDPLTGEVEAYSVNYLKSEWRPLDAEMNADLERLAR